MTKYAFYDDYTALLVEANDYFARVVESMLRGCGIRMVIRVRNSGEAMTLLYEKTYDVVICDFDVEPEGGVALLKLIRNRNVNPSYKIPVIMTCGSANVKDVLAARDSGATEFVTKPLSPISLYRALHSALEKGRPFVETDVYVGPDRRRKEKPVGGNRRGAAKNAAPKAAKQKTPAE